MNALFSTQTNDRTFDTAVNGQTYTAYNDKYKDTQNSLPENIFEKEITQVPQETLIDFSEQKYNKEITINPLKEDITQKAYNQTDIQMANKYNPVLQKDSELLREQRAERVPELMQGHVAQTEGTNPIGDMAILNASQNAQAATRGSLKMMMNRHQFTPRGVDQERWRQEMPDYNYLKQGQDLRFAQQGALYSWNQSQLMNNSENSIQKRQIPNVRLQNQGAQQVMYGMRKAADTTMVSTQKNDIKQRYNIQGNQLGMLPHQVKRVKANEIIQFYQPVSNYQLNALGQYVAPTKIISGMNVGRTVAYQGDAHVHPNIQAAVIPSARKRQTNGGITMHQDNDKMQNFSMQPTVNYTRNYAPTATQLTYMQEQPDVYFTRLAQVTNDTMSRGSPMTIGNLMEPNAEMNVGLMI